MEPISIYIHIPMCVKKCAYCDFTSFCGRMKQREAYTEAVCREMREQAAFFGARRVETVFFGGGTPTLMTGAQIGRMLDTLRSCFALAADAEITMEDGGSHSHYQRILLRQLQQADAGKFGKLPGGRRQPAVAGGAEP